jgi:acetyltransferase-like isoleucine patch superfamily enzyme
MTVGLGTYGQPAVIAFKGEKTPISIGAYCSISEGVELMPGGNHPLEWVSTYPFRHVGSVVPPHDGHPVSKGPIRIGNDVWIARGARILSGVTVGNGAVIGAYSVVSHDVAPYAVVAGVPARQMRLRFSEAQVARLEAIAWWDWRPEEISAAVSLLNGGDVDDFIRAYDVADSI